jgi:peroxiredoxin
MHSHRTLISGILSPLLAALFGLTTYRVLTALSADREADFVFRLFSTSAAMAAPFLLTVALGLLDRRRGTLTSAGRVGLLLAMVSLALLWLPLSGLAVRWLQARDLAIANVEAPLFESVDIEGNVQRLADYRGDVVLIHLWATSCRPCRAEMPALDRLYRQRREQGFIVFGLSAEKPQVQRQFASEIGRVSFPLLTVAGDVPRIYRAAVRVPASFLIDRRGRLQPAPSTGRGFQELAERVDALLAAPID